MTFKAAALMGAAVLAMIAGSASAADLACLITKDDTNPFFVKMKEGELPPPQPLDWTSRPSPA